MGAVEWGLIALQSMLWGSSYFFIAVVQAQGAGAQHRRASNVPAAAVLLLIVLSLGYRLPATLAEWRLFIGFSVFNTVLPFLLIVWGQSRATGGMAAILNATAPLFGIFLAHLLTHDEKLSWSKAAGILVGHRRGGHPDGPRRPGRRIGRPAGAPGAASPRRSATCCANIFVRRRLGGYPPFVIAAMQMVGAIFVPVPLALALDRPWEHAGALGRRPRRHRRAWACSARRCRRCAISRCCSAPGPPTPRW